MHFIKSFSHCSGSVKSLDKMCSQDSTIYPSWYCLSFNSNILMTTKRYTNTLTRVLIKPHYCLKVTVILFTCVQTAPFRKKIGHTKIFEIQQGVGVLQALSINHCENNQKRL